MSSVRLYRECSAWIVGAPWSLGDMHCRLTPGIDNEHNVGGPFAAPHCLPKEVEPRSAFVCS